MTIPSVRSTQSGKLLLLIATAWVLYGAGAEFYHIAWGTGTWLGQFSLKWGLAFFVFSALCIAGVVAVGYLLWKPLVPKRLFGQLLRLLRRRVGILRWLLAVVIILLPVYILQYTFWGIVLHGPYLRLLLLFFSMILPAFLFTNDENRLIDWRVLLTVSILVSGGWVFFSSLSQVTDYPFSLGWSEGNRLWDYSIMFGRRLYNYPPDKELPVYLDVGRQFLGGLPFLLPHITIWQERLWLSLQGVIPYLLLGGASFYLNRKDLLPWVAAAIWAFVFVRQGPIHPPLLLCAIMVALAWRRPLWLAIPLVMAAGFFAVTSRFTWLFAPAMWAVMLEVGMADGNGRHLSKEVWKRTVAVGLAGVMGGYVLPFLNSMLKNWINLMNEPAVLAPAGPTEGITLDSIQSRLSDQPLLWYRLFPNETFAPGILIGLALAVGPLIFILIYLSRSRRWLLNGWQKLAITLPLLAFLVVGLIVSAKIGGGGDLHNLDMFIIGLMFTGAIAWRNGGRRWIEEIHLAPALPKAMTLALLIIPVYWVMMSLRPLSVNGNLVAIVTLSDIAPSYAVTGVLPDPLPDTLPSKEDTYKALEDIRAEVERAAPFGEVLFMDQRQLLTFGYISPIPLVPEYDKKVLIDKAMSEDAAYFAEFYRDLANQRFSLIITNPLNETIKTDEAIFGEENNAWVKWVSSPVLCYYEPVLRLKKVKIQLLKPRQDISACLQKLPVSPKP